MMRTLLVLGLVFFLLWLLGFITSYTFGGALHVLLVIGVILVILSIIFGKRRKL